MKWSWGLWLLSFLFAGITAPVSGATIQPSKKFARSDLSVRVLGESPFTDRERTSRSFVAIKSKEWSACRKPEDVIRFRAAGSDPVDEFLGTRLRLKTLAAMDERKLLVANVKKQPWSGDYWAYSRGLLGARYADPQFLELGDWFARFTFIGENPLDKVLAAAGPEMMERVSPSEKYDLLVADKRRALTASMWEQGKAYYDNDGKVEDWMGLCHGWAAAAMIEPRPVQSIEVASFDRAWSLKFNPSELKGLMSYSWSTNPYDVAFLGERCSKKDPKRDENGRLIDPECFDLNPATWHQVIVHQVGVRNLPFIMDATYDYEVWNQPVTAYSYSYFNPRTMEPAASLESASVLKSEFTKDPFAEYRSGETVTVVGINMVVAYVVETRANTWDSDTEGNDVVRWVMYQYDLELDAKGQLIGGEWHDPVHPDFVWMPKPQARPQSPLDPLLEDTPWDAEGAVPAKWAEAAWRSSQYGIMLHSIPNALFKRAGR